MVAVLTRGEGPAEDALAQLAADLATLQRWRPGPQTLSAAIASLQRRDEGEDDRPLVANGAESEVVIRRYLAAHAFASWMAYQTTGVAAVLASLRVALSALRDHNSRLPLKEAIRETDLQLVHLHGR